MTTRSTHAARSIPLALAVAALAASGCAETPGDELEIRECLWVLSATRHGERFAGREVPVCGSLGALPGGGWALTDFRKPQDALRVRFPDGPTASRDLEEVRAALPALSAGRVQPIEARFHGRIDTSRPGFSELRLSHIDWLHARPDRATRGIQPSPAPLPR